MLPVGVEGAHRAPDGLQSGLTSAHHSISFIFPRRRFERKFVDLIQRNLPGWLCTLIIIFPGQTR